MWIPEENENCQRAPSHQSQTASRTQKTQRLRFPKQARLLTSPQYQKLYRHGRRHVGTYIAIDFRRGYSFNPKLGITVSKKFGKANQRNRFKRIVREAFRLSLPYLPFDIEMNISPRSLSSEAKMSHILEDFKELYAKS
jgi:ribonuclease P protein component